ncbi:MAG: DNA metabolism protein [Dorea sp.]|jgi:probable DNA metabolism protein|nr:DNA metabolism protein [Dorea sp.]
MKTVYVCNDTVTGIFSGIYDAWKSKKGESECEIALRGMLDQQLFCDYVEVEETEHKAIAVEALIKKHLGRRAYWDIYHAVLSADQRKGDAVLGTMLAARMIPDSTKIMEHLSHPKVEKVFELSRNVGGEAHSYKGFLRFRELLNGVLYAEIEPKNQILTCLAPHFADRLPVENWMIHDKAHQMFAVHEAGKKWVILWGEEIDETVFEKVSDKEEEYARLWKGFCRTIAIESRTNSRCQLQHLPLRYRGKMTEFNL